MLQIRHYVPPVTKAGPSVILAVARTTKRARQKKFGVESQFVLSAVGRASRHSHNAESGFGTNVCHLHHDQNWNTTWVLKCFQSWHSAGGASTEHAHTWKEYNCISLWPWVHNCQCGLSRKIHRGWIIQCCACEIFLLNSRKLSGFGFFLPLNNCSRIRAKRKGRRVKGIVCHKQSCLWSRANNNVGKPAWK